MAGRIWHLHDSGQVPSEQLGQLRDSCAPGVSIFRPLDCDSVSIYLNSMVASHSCPFSRIL